jgi:hypothetical protein
MIFQPRQYQTDAIEALHKHICSKETNPCVVVPTSRDKKGKRMKLNDECFVIINECPDVKDLDGKIRECSNGTYTLDLCFNPQPSGETTLLVFWDEAIARERCRYLILDQQNSKYLLKSNPKVKKVKLVLA